MTKFVVQVSSSVVGELNDVCLLSASLRNASNRQDSDRPTYNVVFAVFQILAKICCIQILRELMNQTYHVPAASHIHSDMFFLQNSSLSGVPWALSKGQCMVQGERMAYIKLERPWSFECREPCLQRSNEPMHPVRVSHHHEPSF